MAFLWRLEIGRFEEAWNQSKKGSPPFLVLFFIGFAAILMLKVMVRVIRRPAWATDSEQQQAFCVICMEEKETVEMFSSKNCSHVFCSDCMSKHIATKVEENITTVKCPDVKCEGVLEPEFCKSVIPLRVLEKWENAICISMVRGSQRFYCPFTDCSSFLLNDGGEVITQAECPYCHRLFCVQCKVAWHSGVRCKKFQKLRRDDLMVVQLAKSKNWKRCPKCKFYVEKTQGCLHITCRCGFQFCYGCGSKWSIAHTSCHT